jgi:ADP-ribose pyrophosphatase YjhB (NUDIX family)
MNLIGYSNDQIIKENPVLNSYRDWNIRLAVRAVLMDKEGKVALMHIGKYKVYKLPGGGVDEGEKLDKAFIREILEETGCDARATQDLGVHIEKRGEWKLFQISFCYLAKALHKGKLNLTEEEKATDFSLVWVDNLNKAFELVGQNESSRYDDQYIKIRDTAILKQAIKILKLEDKC